MSRFRLSTLSALALACALVSAQDGGGTASDPSREPPKTKRALNKAFRGRIVKIKKRKVTIYYDFEDPDQLLDFEDARPPRLLDASRNRAYVEGGRLVLEGSTAIRHRMEGSGELRAHFYLRPSQQRNMGTYFSEPVMSDFYVVLNLFDERFYNDGMLLLAACGLHEDEGAQDLATGLVNWRDIFKGNVRKVAPVGSDVEVEVMKDGWTEYCRVGDVEGKGSSKGKTTQMKSYHFGFWVHGSRATIDDLTLTVELTDAFLDLNDLKAEVELEWEEVPESGPFAGMREVPPRLRAQVERYAAGGGEARELVQGLQRTGLPKDVRRVVAEVLQARKDPRTVPMVIDALYSADKTTRELAIGVVKAIVGQTFGYSPGAGEKARSQAIQKLNAYLAEHREKFYG